MRINNNIMALNAHRQLGANQANSAKSMERLSSGFRINRAGDDAAGLAISEKMRGQIRGLTQASRNAQDGISLIQTAEGALNETHSILQRMRELAVQSATDTNTEIDRGEIQKEIDQLAAEIDRIADTTQFNTKELLNGEFKAMFHIGANAGQNVDLSIENMSAGALKVGIEALEAGTAEVAEVADSVVLKSGDTIVAVKVGSGENAKWYDPEDVVKGSGDVLEAKDGAEPLEIAEGKTIDGAGFYTEDKAEIDGIADSSVLLKGETVVAVEVGGKWYAPEDVQSDGETTPALETKADATELEVGDAYVLGDGSGGINVSTQEAADTAITTINKAIETVSAERSKLGAMQNRLEHTIANLGTSAENLQAAESRVRDLDMAEEIMAFTKNSILQQAATAMLAQANMAPQSVLQLLG